ncbi:alpha-amylase family glycosyl hydrolase [Orenia marismortui]|uniref:alpha-amylase family glycosyl hydrolase n=1 Tax=Orenia marismortui TaxID=46469 RepID=UPI00036775B0|nr:alpha-amylase family glycosyl hydrolase [Orenia marismortui]
MSLIKKRSSLFIGLLMLLILLTACSSDGNNSSLNKTGKLTLEIPVPVSTLAITDALVETVEVKLTNQNDPDDVHTESQKVSSGSVIFNIDKLAVGNIYDVEVKALDEPGYDVYQGSNVATISKSEVTIVPVDLKLLTADSLEVNIDTDLDYDSGTVKLINSKYEAEIINDQAVLDQEILANDYTLVVQLFDSSGEEILRKAGEISIFPGRLTITDPIDLGVAGNLKIIEKWEREPQEVVVSADPAGAEFLDSQEITLYVSGSDIEVSRYTLDGSNPATDGIDYSNGDTITIGENMSAGEIKTLRLYGENDLGEMSQSYEFSKIENNSREHPFKLGAVYSRTATDFRIWSPDSSNVTVEVDGDEYDCQPVSVDGYSNIYGVTVKGDLHLKEYQFKINGQPVRDPYGVMAKYDAELANGNEGKEGQEQGVSIRTNVGSSVNIVMDLSRTDIDWSPRPELKEREDSIIYEMSIRDFTIDSTSGVSSDKRGKFLGAVEEGTSYSSVKTGIDHLKELGVTHVQIMPFYDFATKYNYATGEIYNWGYDPVNYNIPEERYSMTPADYEERIKELKMMIDEFHKNDIRVIMDVVYNHTFEDEMFENITDKYYDGQNLSGCGNSLDTGVPMVSRMIRDSLEYWVREYNIDGFRFDLMAVYHDKEVRQWGEYLNDQFSDRNLLLYGEPWRAMGNPDRFESEKAFSNKKPVLADAHVGMFNGGFRDAIKGKGNDATSGYAFNWQGNPVGEATTGNIESGIRGSLMDYKSRNPLGDIWNYFKSSYDPEQTINYISAHDNLCLWDKINTWADANNQTSQNYLKRINDFASSIVLTSQGIPFIHSGDEMLRTKHNGQFSDQAHNSYMWGDEMNKVDWSWKTQNDANANGLNDTFEYFRDLIQLRNEHPGFRLNTWDEINDWMTTYIPSDRGDIVVSQIDADQNSDSWDEIIVIYNPGDNYQVNLPGSGWEKVFDATGANPTDQSNTAEGTAVTIFAK